MFTFSAQDSKHLDRSHKVVWWVTGYYPHHWAFGHYTCRVGRQNQFVHILKLLASQSLSYIVFFFCAYSLFFLLCLPLRCRRQTELVLCNCAMCMLQNYHSGVFLFPYFFLFSLVIICLLSTSLSTLKKFKQDSSPELITILQKCFFDIYSASPLNPFQQLFNNFNEGIWDTSRLGHTGFFRFGFAHDKTPLRLVFELTYIQKEASRDSGGEIVEFE